jgi:alpha-tubulin suppressor-like RCC1 family protein
MEIDETNLDAHKVYSFGKGETLGIDPEYEGININKPTLVPLLAGKNISKIACGSNHTLVLQVPSEIWSWGQNDWGQLGRTRKIAIPQCVQALESHIISDISCGQFHSMVLTHNQNVYSFGRNNFGQIGVEREVESVVKPRLLKQLIGQNIVQISCGYNHNIALSDHGILWGWGNSANGQTGRGVNPPNSDTPLPVLGLESIPICSVCCGSDFSLALTITGNIYSFGHGPSYQSGHGNTKDSITPQLIENSLNKYFVKIACGRSHCLALTYSGVLYGWGDSSFGQLATSEKTIHFPQILEATKGKKVVDIVCGAYHSLIVILEEENNDNVEVVYSFGSNVVGQLGNGTYAQSNQLQKVFVPSKNCVPKSLSVFGGESFSIIKEEPFKQRLKGIQTSINRISLAEIETLVKNYKSGAIQLSAIKSYIEKAFSWPTTLNSSFLIDMKYFEGASSSKSNNVYGTNNFSFVDIGAVRAAFDLLLRLQEPVVLEIVSKSLMRCLSKHKTNTQSTETLRMYLIIMENPVLTASVTKYNLPLFERLINSIITLSEPMKHTLYLWWSMFSSEYFARIVNIFASFLTYLIKNQVDDRLAIQTIKLLSVLYKINIEKEIIPYQIFYLGAEITKSLDLNNEYKNWVSQNAVFTYITYPFFLPPEAKLELIRIDARAHQIQTFFQTPTDPLLILAVRREFFVKDALAKLSSVDSNDLSKKLIVQFVDEPGVDEGGLSKEFFQLIVNEIMDPVHGLFTVEEETHYSYFNPNSVDIEEFYLMGLIMGLAIYNNVLLDIRFPNVIYKMILGDCPGESIDSRYQYKVTTQDMLECYPTIGKNLLFMKTFNGNIEETFGEYFQVTERYFDQVKTIDLIPNGGNVAVTNSNINQYIQCFIEYELYKKIEKQFSSFKRGFLQVFKGDILKIFRAEELSKCICGEIDLIDTAQLKKICKYEGDFVNKNYIDQFWRIFDSFSQEEKRSFLFFVTGTDRLPVGGAARMSLMIQKNGSDTELLPTSATCFNTLLLPEYSTPEKLETKLKIILQNKEGFGLR